MGPAQRATKKATKPTATHAKAQRPLVRAALAVSIDGYIADRNGGVEWLNPYFSDELDFAGFMRSIGATVMGRKTYDISLALGGGAMSMGPCVVLTHRPVEKPPKATESFAGDVRALIDRLRADLNDTGKDIWLIGGGESIDAFRAAGLVDRFELGIIPVLLGDGIPMFPRHERGLEGFRQTHFRALKNGIIEAWYEPA